MLILLFHYWDLTGAAVAFWYRYTALLLKILVLLRPLFTDASRMLMCLNTCCPKPSEDLSILPERKWISHDELVIDDFSDWRGFELSDLMVPRGLEGGWWWRWLAFLLYQHKCHCIWLYTTTNINRTISQTACPSWWCPGTRRGLMLGQGDQHGGCLYLGSIKLASH